MNKIFPTAGFLTLSVLVHSGLFVSLERFYGNTRENLAQTLRENSKKEKLEFRFVEAPPKNRPEKPENAQRISDRDALNQDRVGEKSKATGSPHTELEGFTDQLAQQRGADVQGLSPPPEEKPESASKKFPESQEILSPKPPAPAAEPAGQHKITTQEMSKLKSPGAALFGQTSFEATGSGMVEYMKNLKEKVWLSWFPYLVFQYPQDFRGSDAVVSFTLSPRGELKIIQVVESEGSAHFAAYCVEAIQRASPFGPLPAEILALVGKDEIEIRFGFHYR